MDTLSYKTISANKQTVNKEWVIVDAKDQVVGRLSSKIASILRGKNKTNFTPHVDCGDNVIVINAEKVKFTGKKMTDKQYVRHTGHPGGQRFATPRELMEKDGRRVVEYAVKGMLPKTRLGRQQFTNLYVYEGAEHPHQAQNPKSIEI
ncbi:50S ribosomal protein L13 [Jiulongibacter sp. NS-SX5]|uniref:50S ribosomal protein L13 n=1 Tax=Jiulongibacter sp. NS-SX5 TaxID=3463854 RepID=UPI0040595992